MTDIDFIIHASAAVNHCLGVQHRAVERAFPRGTALSWRKGEGFASGIVLANGFGRRLFVEDFQTGRAGWIGLAGIRLEDGADLATQISQLGPEIAFRALAEADSTFPHIMERIAA